MTQTRNSKRGFTAVELVLVIVVLAIVVTVTLVQVDKKRQAKLRAESHDQMLAVYDAFTSGCQYPPLSREPGQLVPSGDNLECQKSQAVDEGHQFVSTLVSPAHPDADRLQKEARGTGSAFTDDSYWYLGYALPNEDAGLVFVEVYKKALETTGEPPTGEFELESSRVVVTDPTHVTQSSVDLPRSMSFLSPLRGVLIADAEPIEPWRVSWRTPSETVTTWSMKWYWLRVPIFIERPGLLKGGSHVLWSDTTVEFIPYPGKWPMTEKFIKALESLDELKESHADTAEE